MNDQAEKITREEFIKDVCDKRHLTREEAEEKFSFLECTCGAPICRGWVIEYVEDF